MKIAFLHLAFCGLPQVKNTLKILQGMKIANKHEASWVITPEMAVQGYHMMRSDFPFQLISCNNGLLDSFSESARQYQQRLFLGCGFIENKVPHNSCVILDSTGSFDGCHHKVKVVPWITENWAHKGESFVVHNLENIKTSVMICADSYFAEHGKIIAKKGAEISIVMAAWPPGGHSGPPEVAWQRLSKAAGGIPVLVCNQTGNISMDFSQAQSAVIVNGNILFTYSGEEAVLIIDFDVQHKKVLSQEFEIIKFIDC